MPGRFDHKKAGQGQELEKDKDLEKDPNKEKKAEADQTKAQGTVGNQALNAMISARAEGSAAPGEGGSGRSVRVAKPHEKEGQDYGGADDAADDAQISLDDLVRSWNPGIKKSEDKARFVEPMPDDDLPPEDPEFLAAVGDIAPDDDLEVTLEHFLQPTVSVVATSLRGWCRAAARFSGSSPGERVLAAALMLPPTLLQSPDARVLLGRSVLACLALQLVAHGQALSHDPDSSDVLVVWMCLELEGRIHRVDNVLVGLEGLTAKLPRAVDLFLERYPGTDPLETLPDPAPTHAGFTLRAALDALCRWEDLEGTIPQIGLAPAVAAPAEADDPLGIDAVIQENTGGPEDVLAGVYLVAIQNAERLASAASVTRLRWVATAFLIEEVAGEIGASLVAPLLTIAEVVDRQIDDALQLLLEVARASQKRSVAPKGVRNGLTRVARQLDQLRSEILDGFSACLCSLLEREPVLPPPIESAQDALDAALDARDPQEALSLLTELGSVAQVLGARAFLRAMCGLDPTVVSESSGQALGAALREGEERWVVPSSLLRAHAMIHAEDFAGVLRLSEGLRATAEARSDGLLLAESAFLEMEARIQLGDSGAVAAIRLDAARACARLGAYGALSLLARWAPPVEDESDYTPFFDYPMDVDEGAASASPPAEGIDPDDLLDGPPDR